MKNYNEREIAVILLDFFEGLEYKHKRSILSLYENAEDIFKNIAVALKYVRENVGESAALTMKNCFENGDYANFILQKLQTRNLVAITCLSDGFPKIFANLPSNPLVIYAKGNLKLLECERKFAIVGSRKTLPFVLKTSESIAKALSSNGVAIVSGSAVGGDRSALLGAVESGNVISILASGHDFLSPQSNRDLIEKIAKNGLVISEYPPETPSAPWRFPMRNRLIAALSDGVLILSGRIDSGTRWTAKFAEAYSKRIYAIPYSLGEQSGEICNMLIKLGKAQLIENAEDVAEYENVTLGEEQFMDLEEEEIEILEAITGEITLDNLALSLGKKVFEIMPVLSMLEIKGAVARGANNTYTVLIKLKK